VVSCMGPVRGDGGGELECDGCCIGAGRMCVGGLEYRGRPRRVYPVVDRSGFLDTADMFVQACDGVARGSGHAYARCCVRRPGGHGGSSVMYTF